MDFYDEIKELRIQYLESLIGEIKKYLSRLSDDKLSSDELRSFAHRIKGSGASYGFEFVTNKAVIISDILKKSNDMGKVRELLLKLEKECNASLNSLKSKSGE